MTYTLLTGGVGYIGSHICVELYKKTDKIIVFDNYSNSKKSVNSAILSFCPNIELYEGNLTDRFLLENIFKKYNISTVIHLAGFKSVTDSIENPLKYYNNNITGTIQLLDVMKKYKCTNLVFSSSATVYGDQTDVPIKESANTYNKQTNPYGKSKMIIEMMLRDLYISPHNWNIVILRYFNPVGADPSGKLGEDPIESPSNLFPHIIDVYLGKQPELKIYGNSYKTVDGTCIRDFIHVVDLAIAHISSIEFLENEKSCYEIINIGTGKWYTVYQIVERFNEITNNKIPFVYAQKRAGDIPLSFACCNKAKNLLGWQAVKGLDDMIRDSITRANYISNTSNNTDD